MSQLKSCAGLGIGLLLAATACGTSDAPPTSEAPPAASLESFSPARTSLPKRGELLLELDGDRLTLHARSVARELVLARLAADAGFDLELGDMPPRTLTLSIENETRARALEILLAGVSYQTAFELHPETGLHRLAWLRAGRVAAEEEAPIREVAQKPRGLRGTLLRLPRKAGATTTPEEREAEEIRRAALARLDDPDPDQRAWAVSFLRPKGDGLDRLRDLAAGDPQVSVRSAAVSQLGEGESFGAKEGLIEALSDPDSEVVIEAIEELAFDDDPTVITHLKPLLGHADHRIADAATEAIEFLEF